MILFSVLVSSRQDAEKVRQRPLPCRVKRETRMVFLVYLVYLVCLVERDKPDERNRRDEPDEPVPPVSLGYPT
jgi:hypothetical protein